MKLSVVICSYNREKFILDALNSLAAQSIDKNDFEIVVINNNSTDHTEAICRKFGADHPYLNYIYDIETVQGLSSARNRGIAVSSGNYIAFIDDDALAERDYAANIISAFEKYPQYDAVGGKVLPIYPNDKEPAWMSHHIQGVVSKVDMGDKFMEFRKKYPVGCNMAFRKEVFEELGGFNTDLLLRNDDKFIFLKLKRNNKRTLYVPDAVVHHNIDAYRLEHGFIRNLSKLIGSTEKIRLQTEPRRYMFMKPMEYLFKWGASLVLGILFLLKGQPAKARYIIMIRWLVLAGFLGRGTNT
ncbi:MAG: glycosyltransferase [Bacteroidetes bacterium]|nr:glycosyltransferase [Bacteroidota bacterium]